MTNQRKDALLIDGTVDEIRRLERVPPTKYSKTIWTTSERAGNTVLFEIAVIECPECGEEATWRGGIVACNHCDTHKEITQP